MLPMLTLAPLSPLIEGFGDPLGPVGSRFAPLKPTNKDARTKVPVVTAGLPSNRLGIQEVVFVFFFLGAYFTALNLYVIYLCESVKTNWKDVEGPRPFLAVLRGVVF